MEINNRYIDWQPIVAHITNAHELTILELGCGSGTKFLLDKFKFVYSYEANTRDTNGNWFKASEEEYKNLQWKGFFDTRFPNVRADVSIADLISGIKEFVDLNLIDVIFVDPGFKNRAEAVVAFANMEKYKYIFTHDTNTEPSLYNWPLLDTMPSCYTLHAKVEGQGTKLWKLNNI